MIGLAGGVLAAILAASAAVRTGIAKAMGMSGPALYRYCASRDDLLVALIEESYEDLADTLTEVARRNRSGTPAERLRAALTGTRQWALREAKIIRRPP